MESDVFIRSHLNGEDSFFPGSLYSAEDMLNIANFSAFNLRNVEIWMEVAVFLDVNGIALATLSSPLYEEPVLFLVEKENELIIEQIKADLLELQDWEG